MFYDRELERRKIISLMQCSDNNQSKIILIIGYSGVGKTGLMSEIFSTGSFNDRYIQVHTSQIGHNSLENCLFFNRLYEEIINKSKKNLNSNIKIKSSFAKHKFFQFIKFLINWLFSYFKIYENEDFFGSKENINLLQKRNYIVDYLNKVPQIINVDNIQFIDRQSLDFFKDIIHKVKRNVFVFEFTLCDNNEDNLSSLYSELNQFGIDVETFRLEKLDNEYAIKLLPEQFHDNANMEQALKNYNDRHGNLYQIILYNNDFYRSNSDQITNRINNLIANTEENDKLFLLNLIYLNEGSLECGSLHTLATCPIFINSYNIFSEQKYIQCVNELKSQKFINIVNGGFHIHDSVIAALENQNNNPMLYSAYNTLTQYYNNWNPQDPSQQMYRLSKLFSLYLRFTDEQLIMILPEIRHVILSNKYPQAIYNSLQKFANQLYTNKHINQKLYEEISKLLIEICIEIGDAPTARDVINKLSQINTSDIRILKARVYELGTAQSDIDEISKLIEQSSLDSQERLLLELCKIHIIMRISNQSISSSEIQKIIGNEFYKNYPEYAFVLSNQAELIDSPKDAIQLYGKGIEILNRHEKKAWIGCLYNNMCMSYGYIGDFSEAENCIHKAKQAGINMAFYLNNIVTLKILQNNITFEDICLLKDALLLNINKYEQIVIHNNLLIIQILLQNSNEAQKEFVYLTECNYEEFNYAEFLHMCYQNLLFYSKRNNLQTEISKYTNKLYNLLYSEYTSQGTKDVIKAMLEHDDSLNIFYANYDYRPEFLCYWGIPATLR